METTAILLCLILAVLAAALGLWLFSALKKRDEALRARDAVFEDAALLRARYDGALAAEASARAQLEKTLAALRLADAEQARLQERASLLQTKLDEHGLEISKVREKMFADFENMSNKLLEGITQKFSSSNKEQIGHVLSPLKEDIAAFKERVEKLNLDSQKSASGLYEQIKNLGDVSVRLGTEAENLTKALKGQNKVAGNWGEMILSKMLDSCGLAEGREYRVQPSYGEGGARFVPDVVVDLPGGKCIIIDSKVSLLDYERCASAEDSAPHAEAFGAFKNSVKRHIDELSAKNYQALAGMPQNPDFVMMFIPVEPAFIMLLSAEPEILEYAFKKKVMLVAPATLLAALKTVEVVWRTEKQQKSTLEIARLGGQLYDKLKLFSDRFLKIGERIGQLDREYLDAKKTLADGRGSALDTAEKLTELGIKVKKRIDSKLAVSADIEDEGASALDVADDEDAAAKK